MDGRVTRCAGLLGAAGSTLSGRAGGGDAPAADPEEDPAFYRGLASRTFFDRVTEPVLVHHGTADDTCPVRWSRRTHRLLRAADVDSTLRFYYGEQHALVPQWEPTVRFLRRRLRA